MNGKEIKLKRIELNLSQEELGAKLGMSKNTIYNYENGGKIPGTKIPILVKFFENYSSSNMKEDKLSNLNLFISDDEIKFPEKEGIYIVSENIEYFRGKYRYFDLIIQDIETKAVTKFLEDQGIKVDYK